MYKRLRSRSVHVWGTCVERIGFFAGFSNLFLFFFRFSIFFFSRRAHAKIRKAYGLPSPTPYCHPTWNLEMSPMHPAPPPTPDSNTTPSPSFPYSRFRLWLIFLKKNDSSSLFRVSGLPIAIYHLVTAVLITIKGAESPSSRRIGVIGALVYFHPSETGQTFLSLAGLVLHWDKEK